MTSVRLAVVSDSHLSPRTPEATSNWDLLVEHVELSQPDAVVHTGDIALDGAALDGAAGREDLVFARRQLDKMSPMTLALPGNHDLGDNPCETNAESGDLITSARLSAYREHVGEDRWAVDIGGWRLVGFNAQLLGSGLEEEADQWDWLEQELTADRHDGRHSAVFLHKPLFHSLPHPAEHDVAIRYIRPGFRERLVELFENVGTRLIVSGHVHQHRHTQVGGADHVWCPTSWATLPAGLQALIGERWVGGLELTLADDGSVAVDQLRPAGIGQHVIGETIPNPYDH
ncbi:MAG: metallophosphoesterase [Actinomycetota bacterium]|nr:metallophosphoesterase [Actinomycetota bacterium]